MNGNTINKSKVAFGGVDDKKSHTSVVSVGNVLSSHTVLGVNHPTYKLFGEAVTAELREIAGREAERRASANPLLLPVALSTDELSALAAVYPEFAVTIVPLARPVHAFWRASRIAANEWLQLVSGRYSDSVTHYGGSLFNALVASRSGVHLEADYQDEVMAHELIDDMSATVRVFSDYAAVHNEHGVVLPRQEYDKYLQRQGYSVCADPYSCVHQTTAMCVDLTQTELSPVQVALAMIQHGSTLCHGFFLYNPAMLVQDTGDFGLSGVTFERTPDSIYFRYPEGNSGVKSYSRAVWAKWLGSHMYTVAGEWFHLELLKHRDAFMFFRIVRTSVSPVDAVSVSHALDFELSDEMTLVKSWKLKGGLRSDSTKASSWVPFNFLVRTRVVDRVYEFAMQLKPDSFSRYAIKKQIRVVNNRWVVSGTTVSVTHSLDSREVEDLTTALYARAFVDRFESSALADDMMRSLKALVKFNSSSWFDRVAIVSKACFSAMYSASVGPVVDTAVGFFEAISRFCAPTTPLASDVALVGAPVYQSFSSAVGTWRSAFNVAGESLYHLPVEFGVGLDAPSSFGGAMLAIAKDGLSSVGLVRGSYADVSATNLVNVVRVCTELVDTRLVGERVSAADGFVQAVEALNPLDSVSTARHVMKYQVAERLAQETVQDFKDAPDPDPIHTLNEFYGQVLPSVAAANLEYDTYSLSLDPQDRVLAAQYMRMSTYFGLPPAPREYYESKLRALNVPKRQNTAQELLTAINARNLSAPVVSLPQEQDLVIKDIWGVFLDTACVDDAREKLAMYQSDPVALAEDALRDWAAKAKPDVLERVKAELRDNSQALAQMKVGDYLAMLKADVKPTLSVKPVTEVTAPQVIVYHEKALSALYSSIFRVLVRRFLSLLRSNIHVNLLKDTKDIAEFITANHPFGRQGLKFIENDFSKYDKSQSEFVFALEEFVFRQLGMNEELLQRWVEGHVECSIRSLCVSLSLHTLYQRKSGDGTTSFGNVVLNILSVMYAYRSTKLLWAVFMGDDSLGCAQTVGVTDEAVKLLAEVFNLTAKCFITESPYFASNFVVLDEVRLQATLLPDPVKRVEKLSMHVSADDPQWKERHVSFADALGGYKDSSAVMALAKLVPMRYEVEEGAVRGAAAALGTLVRDFDAFRSVWGLVPVALAA